jgi:hypothetical protein
MDVFTIDEGGLSITDRSAEAVTIRPVEWHVEIQGRVVRFFRSGAVMPKRTVFDRKVVGPWSIQSRMRLLRLLNRIDYPRLGKSVFVTLTYPDSCQPKRYAERTRHRAKFLRWMEESLGREISVLWRVEWEERKSGAYTGKLRPHFHLMVFGVARLDWCDVRECWRDCIGAGKGPLKTWVRSIYNEDGACRYLSKYVAKYRSLDIVTYLHNEWEFGRHWGVTRPSLVPMCPVVLARQLSASEIRNVKAFARARNPWYGQNGEIGFTLLGDGHAKRFAKWLGDDKPQCND